jgi:hypothetical protein
VVFEHIFNINKSTKRISYATHAHHAFRNYMFLPRENCTLEWPVRYVLNHDQYVGWMKPVSHEITQEATEVVCPPDSFYFDTGNGTLLLSNRTVKYNLPLALVSYEPTHKFKKLDSGSAFTGKGAYGTSEVSQFKTIYQMERGMIVNLQVHEIMQKHRRGEPLSENEVKTAEAIEFFAFQWFWKHVGTYIYVAIGIGNEQRRNLKIL